MDDARVLSIKRMCHVYPVFGITDMRLFGSDSPYFTSANSAVPAPDNGFHVFEDGERLSANLREHVRVERLVRRQNGVILRSEMDVVKTMRSYVSLGNGLRTREEMVGRGSFIRAREAYERAITYSFDESAIATLGRIKKHPTNLMMTSTNDMQTNLVPEPVRALVAEAFCGLAMVAVHENELIQALGFAMIATFKHEMVSLPLINSVRLMAAAKLDVGDCRTLVESMTSIVLLPAFSRSANQAIKDLHGVEIDMWSDASRAQFAEVEERVSTRTANLADRFAHAKCIVRSRINMDGEIVEKICPVCGAGVAGEALKRCGACKLVCYCSKECQRIAWPVHKAVCGRGAI